MNITRMIDTSGRVVAEKQNGREVFNHHGQDDEPLAVPPCVGNATQPDDGPLVMPSTFEATNPTYGNGPDEEPLQAPSIMSERKPFTDGPLRMPSCFD